MLLREPYTLRPSIGLSALAGLRSMSPLAVFSYALNRRPQPNQHWIIQRLGSKNVATLLAILAAGEVIGDKMPFAPARTSDTALLGRLAVGSLLGAATGLTYKQPVLEGAIQGGVAAAVSTYGSYYLRRFLGPILGLPEPLPGFLEDALVLFAGLRLIETLEQSRSIATSRLSTRSDTM